MDAAAAVPNAEQFGCFALEPGICWVSSQSERDLGRWNLLPPPTPLFTLIDEYVLHSFGLHLAIHWMALKVGSG